MLRIAPLLLVALGACNSASHPGGGPGASSPPSAQHLPARVINLLTVTQTTYYYLLDRGSLAGLSVGQRGHFECFPHPFVVSQVTEHRASVAVTARDGRIPRLRARVAVGDQPSEPYCPSEAQ